MKRYRMFFGALLAVFLLAGGAGREAVRAPVRDTPPAPAEAPAQARPEAAAAAQEDHICLWKIAAPENAVYLLGSLHLLAPEDYPLDKRYEDAYRSADTVVFETDLASLETSEFLSSMLAQAMYTGGRTLEEQRDFGRETSRPHAMAGFAVGIVPPR